MCSPAVATRAVATRAVATRAVATRAVATRAMGSRAERAERARRLVAARLYRWSRRGCSSSGFRPHWGDSWIFPRSSSRYWASWIWECHRQHFSRRRLSRSRHRRRLVFAPLPWTRESRFWWTLRAWWLSGVVVGGRSSSLQAGPQLITCAGRGDGLGSCRQRPISTPTPIASSSTPTPAITVTVLPRCAAPVRSRGALARERRRRRRCRDWESPLVVGGPPEQHAAHRGAALAALQAVALIGGQRAPRSARTARRHRRKAMSWRSIQWTG